jgi:hypothetical protein
LPNIFEFEFIGFSGFSACQNSEMENSSLVDSPLSLPLSARQIQLWDLPDALLFHIVTYLAPPTLRAGVLCHQIAPLCRASYQKLLVQDERSIWDLILQADYGVDTEGQQRSCQRRASQRLRRSPACKVRDAHLLINDNTEIAYFYLFEMVNAKAKKDELSLGKMHDLFEEYGPHLRVNRPVSSGGLYLVEVCRAKHVHESVILKCVKELVENRGALVNMRSNESTGSIQNALCVAAVRGMPKVVRYLLEKGADKTITSSGRFALHTNPKKSIRYNQVTPLEFARGMRAAEINAGASHSSLTGLNACIKLLEQTE